MNQVDTKREIVKLRAHLHINRQLDADFRSQMKTLFARHGIEMSEAALDEMQIVHARELMSDVASPIDSNTPGGDEPPADSPEPNERISLQ